MRVITFEEIIYKGKPLCDCLIQDGMDLKEVFSAYCSAYASIKKAVSLDSVNISQLGINDTCKIKAKNLLSEILNFLIKADVDVSKNMEQVYQTIKNIQTTLSQNSDQYVKVSATDPSSGYLGDKLQSLQPGTMIIDAGLSGQNQRPGKISFIGFVPVGAVMFINRSKLSDFDNTGKGKPGSDVWGYAICNGLNGTVNRLAPAGGGYFPRYVPAAGLTSAGNKGGEKEFTVKKENIETMEIPVKGTIEQSLLDPIQLEIWFDSAKITDGAGGNTFLAKIGDGQNGTNHVKTKGGNFKHSHNFSLKGKIENIQPEKIPLVPEHILEVPIERITV